MTSRILRHSILSAFAMSFVLASTCTEAQPAKKTKKAKPAAEASASQAKKTEKSDTAKATRADDDAIPQGESLKFNTDSEPASTDRHPPMIFKDPGATPLGSPRPEYADSVPEDAGYKAYLGYPKHQFGIYATDMTLGNNWSSQGRDYNFNTSSVGFGLAYRLLVSPLWNIEVDYNHYSMKMDKASVTPFTFQESTVGLDNYSIRNRFCMIGKSTFYQQFCPGIDIGNDSYPIVNYSGTNTLSLARIQDWILGVNLAYQAPITESVLFRATVGYNYGTGVGNSGYLTSKANSSYFANADVEWTVASRHIIQIMADYKARNAKVEGNVNASVKDTWETKSTSFGGRLGYIYSFN